MNRRWTFGRAVSVGFASITLLSVLVGACAIASLRYVSATKDRVITVDQRLVVLTAQMGESFAEKRAVVRGYLMTGDDDYLTQASAAQQVFLAATTEARQLVHTAEGVRLLDLLGADGAKYQTAVDTVVAMKQGGDSVATVTKVFETTVRPLRSIVTEELAALAAHEQHLADADREAATAATTAAIRLVIGLVLVATAVSVVLGFLLSRRVRHLIGRTVSEVRSSSAELQATASQQASSAKQQASAMTEITTTVTELLATSRQIAESAQRVTQVADRTAGAGRTGGGTVTAAQQSMADIRCQVDVIVSHMVELGQKSQRIGVVLEIVSELAEQTNILAINSTIEAAGAGDSGKRFAVVADEIRKLADRVADSTKEIRDLIEVIHAAVSTTVMATEIGAKAVDGGTQRFGEVASSFDEIATLVTTTMEAAREIELSTRQQASAVEQVTLAVTSVTQATKESEASASQTLLTAGQLAGLSGELQRLVQSGASA
jgi:methyl-accepting chemotaxis protein